MVLIELLITVAVIGLGALALIGWMLRPVFRWVVRQCRVETQQEEQVAEIRRRLSEEEKAARREAEAEVEQFMTPSQVLHHPEAWAPQSEQPEQQIPRSQEPRTQHEQGAQQEQRG